MARRRKLLIPEARDGMDKLKVRVISQQLGRHVPPKQVKYEVAKQVGVPLSSGYNGEMKTKNAGKVGGEIGGKMVKELVRMAQSSLTNELKGK